VVVFFLSPGSVRTAPVQPDPADTLPAVPAKLIGPLPWPRQAEDGTPLGLDLGKPLSAGRPPAALEVQAIVFKFLEGVRVPFDRDDLLQEVLLTIHRRNRYPSAFDPRLATFGKYVWLVCRNVLGHMLQRAERSEAEVTVDELPDLADEAAQEQIERVEWVEEEADPVPPVPAKPLAALGGRRRRTVEFEVALDGAPKDRPPPGCGKVVPFKRPAKRAEKKEPKRWEQLAMPWAA